MAGNTSSSTTSKRGFAPLDEEEQREMASQEGRAPHKKGTAPEFNSEEAKKAGLNEGESQNGEDMVEIGEEGRQVGGGNQSSASSSISSKHENEEESGDNKPQY
jgi:uncharacterized protein